MKFKLVENLGTSLKQLFRSAAHDVDRYSSRSGVIASGSQKSPVGTRKALAIALVARMRRSFELEAYDFLFAAGQVDFYSQIASR